MFSKVYANPFDPELKTFYSNFKKWYGKEPMSLVPKYGILGYDVAKFFFEALSRYGEHLEERLDGQLSDGLKIRAVKRSKRMNFIHLFCF